MSRAAHMVPGSPCRAALSAACLQLPVWWGHLGGLKPFSGTGTISFPSLQVQKYHQLLPELGGFPSHAYPLHLVTLQWAGPTLFGLPCVDAEK